MITKITNGKVLVNGVFQEIDLYLEGKKIVAIGEDHSFDTVLDAHGNYVTAGFIDLHCHGGGGADFTDGDAEKNRLIAQMHLTHGTTTLFPTVLSAESAVLKKALSEIEIARRDTPSLERAHIEGPYFAPAQMGAQNGAMIRVPRAEEYGEILADYEIARWDYAPELDEDFSFVEALRGAGVIPAAAHTDATCEQMISAAERGCRLITHFYSCMTTVRREQGFRVAGVIEATYLSDELSAELIADGCHLPDSLLRLAYKLKGADRLALVTDGMRAAGTDILGTCEIGGVPCIIEDGVAKLCDRSAFAGSIATADRLIRTVVSAGIPLTDAVKMMTETPARLMGLAKKGTLAVGNDADLVIFDKDVQIKSVILQGAQVV